MKNQKSSNPAHIRAKKKKTENPYMVEKVNQLNNPSDVTPALIAHLAGRFSPEFIAGKVEELLNATHVTQGGREIADNRAREAGLKLLMSYLIGLPVQRQEIVQVNCDSLEELQRRAQQSPALRSAVAKILEPLPGNRMPDSVKQREGEPSQPRQNHRQKKALALDSQNQDVVEDSEGPPTQRVAVAHAQLPTSA